MRTVSHFGIEMTEYDEWCGDCGAKMVLRSSQARKSVFYGCSRFPACRGSLSANFDGEPLGVPGSQADREARRRAHEVLDQLWSTDPERTAVYKWLAEAMGLSEDEAHFGNFSAAQCERAIKLIRKQAKKDGRRLKEA